MENLKSDRSFYIESDDDDEDAGKDGNDSDSSDEASSVASQEPKNRPSSYNISWPQSYRQSMDMYSSVPSPSIGFLGTPSLSKLSGSFLSSTLTRRHTPETLPLLPTTTTSDVEQVEQQVRRSSHSLLPPLPEEKVGPAQKPSNTFHEEPVSRQCSYGQAVLNGMNVLCGVGILSTPYAVKQGGWMSISILFIFAVLSWYTGILLRKCLDSEPGIETYPDIGQAAFGMWGRIIISACCVEYIILEGDNLSSLFPNLHLNLGGLELNSHHIFAVLTAVAVLPTVCLRDLTLLSYISAGGVVASMLAVGCLFWAGLVDHVGFQSKGTILNLTDLPVAIGLYGYCYSGHAVFPNIYTSMAKPNQYPSVLLTSFALVTVMYAGTAFMGYIMFGETTLSQFTLNMPQDLVASKIAVWTTVVNPFTKFALTLTPVALSLEELIPSSQSKSHLYSILIRTALVFSTLVVGLSVPFFGLVMSLIGSFLTMLVTLILPCACFLSILKGKVTRLQGCLCVLVIVIGLVSCIIGTMSALAKIIDNLK
ncbi:hypothetical protein Scep_005064 [Stephania cephalantha]|uniref:Amino acid transporter transmembrane domain-containing protein n=1 Tax=Stephania cephalantha TaxID=152367 RepID=A0AAP0KW54_9MAGN